MRKILILALLLYDVVVHSSRRAIINHQNNRENDDIGRQKLSYSDDDRMFRKKPQIDLYEIRRTWEEKKESNERRSLGRRKPSRLSSYEEQEFPGIPNRSGDYTMDETRKQIDQISMEKDPERKSFHWDCDREHERYESCFAGCSSVTCDNPRDRLKPCYPFCEPGCICIPPLVRDDRTHKCVMPNDCTKGLKGIPDLNQVDEIAL